MIGVISVITIQKVICKCIAAKIQRRASVNCSDLVCVHAVELDVDTFTIIKFGIQDNGLDCDRKIEVEYFKGCVENISLKDTVELSPYYKINQFILIIFLHSYLRALSQLNGRLPWELQHYRFGSLTCELAQNVVWKISMIEAKEESS